MGISLPKRSDAALLTLAAPERCLRAHALPRSVLVKKSATQITNHINPTNLERGRRIELLALAWKAKVLPLYEPRTIQPKSNSYAIFFCWWRGLDSNQRTRKRADLQSAAINHSATSPLANLGLCHEIKSHTRRACGAAFAAHQSMGLLPCCTKNAFTCPKWPQPMNGAGGRRADNGDGWLAVSTK
jgi:hypothetical protein